MIDFYKLTKMPVNEIVFRLKEKVHEKYEYILHVFGKDILSDEKWRKKKCRLHAGVDKDGLLYSSFKRNKQNQFFTEAYEKTKRLAFIKKNLDYDELISEAELVLDGGLSLLGKNIRLNKNEDWNADPVNGFHWPKVFYASVKKDNKTKQHDIKYVWEINRHQFLIVLAKAYWITGNEKYAEKVINIIRDWILKNPYNLGVNWTSSLELAVRSISWIWAYFMCMGSIHQTPELHRTFMKSIYEHGKHINKHLSYYSSPYNHLIGEASALHIIGTLFPQFKEASKWESLGWSILESQVERQFHDDGMCVEQASFYHHFTLGFYVQSVLLRKLNKKLVSKKLLLRLERAFEISMYITKPDGTVPMIGDIDNARSLYFSSQHSWDFRGFLGIGAILFKRSDFKSQCDGMSEEILWLCDDKMIEGFIKIEDTIPQETSKAFYKSGYFISRDSWEDDSHYLCFDCGEISDGLHEKAIPSAAHGHADALSFELSVYGKTIIVDSGFYTYFGDLDWHKHFRQEEAHNTIRVGHYRQADYCGRLTWKSVKQPELEKWNYNSQYCFVIGKIEYENEIYCEREILYLNKAFWLFNDYVFIRDKDMDVKSYLHFRSGVDLVIDERNNTVIAKMDNVGIVLRYFADAKVTATRGGNKPADGWVARGYGIKEPAWQLQFSWTATMDNTLFPILIIPWKERHDSIRFNKTRWCPEGESILETNLSVNGDSYKISIGRKRNIRIRYGKKDLNIYK